MSTTTPHDLAHAIAAHLPSPWRNVTTPYPHLARIRDAHSGAALVLRIERGRLVVTPGTPDGATDADMRHATLKPDTRTFNPNRDPKVIARALIREVFGPLLDWHARVERVHRERAAAATVRDEHAERLAQAAGTTSRLATGRSGSDYPDAYRHVDAPPVAQVWGGGFSLTDPNRVTLVVHDLPTDLACEIAALMRKHADRDAGE